MASPGQNQLPDTSVDPEHLSHYERLHLHPGASTDEIIKAYRQQAKKYHPDKSLDDKSEEWMKCLNEAKEVLLSDKRSEYDEKLADEGHMSVHRQHLGYLPEGMSGYYIFGVYMVNNNMNLTCLQD